MLQVEVHTVTLDVSEIKTLDTLPDQLPVSFRDVDILVNNAGKPLKSSELSACSEIVCYVPIFCC